MRRVPPDERDALTHALATERTKDALVEHMRQMAVLPTDEMLDIFVDVLLALGQDADRLKLRIAELLAAKYVRRTEAASPAQIALFARALQTSAGSSPPDADAGDDTQQTQEALTVPELIAKTNSDIDALVSAKQKAAAEEREKKRAEAKTAAKEAQGHWPTHLPVEERTVDVPAEQSHCEDSECGVERTVIGRETSWRLESETTSKVIVTHRLIRACPAHHGAPVTTAAAPAPVDGGRLGFSVAARSLWLRFAHNLPVLRIAEMWQTMGLPITDDMLHTLFDTTARRATPVINALIAEVRAASVVNIDDTPVLILGTRSSPTQRGRRRGRMWLALGDKKFAWFFATKSWKEAEAEQRLGKLTGVLQGDGYSGFSKLVRVLRIRRAGCMAHLRRKLLRALKAGDERAAEALGLIGALYRVERLGKLRGLDAAGLLLLRQERSVALMAALEAWAVRVAPGIERGSPLGQAWTYLDNQLLLLRRFLEDGAVSIDNNSAERGLRRITIGRKLWLFFRADRYVERAAILGSLFLTARLHGADELAYMRWLLVELARREWSDVAARRLLPDVWLAQHKPQEGSCVEP